MSTLPSKLGSVRNLKRANDVSVYMKEIVGGMIEFCRENRFHRSCLYLHHS